MKLSFALSQALRLLALAGGVLSVGNGLYYFYRLLQWGIKENWHFTYVSGWGFRFLFHLELAVIALLLTAPFLALVKREAAAGYFPSRKLVISLVGTGLLILFLATVAETLLQKFVP